MANMKMSGQKLLYRMLMVSLSRPQAVKGESLHKQVPYAHHPRRHHISTGITMLLLCI